jgi:hypothetical protein
MLSVTWDLPDGSRLSLVANLSEAPGTVIEPPRGRMIWGRSPEGGMLPAWTVLWSIEERSAS